MVEQLLFLEQYYRHLIMENLERVDLVVRDLCKLKKSVFHEILVKILFFVNKLFISLLGYVGDLLAFPVIADVIGICC